MNKIQFEKTPFKEISLEEISSTDNINNPLRLLFNNGEIDLDTIINIGFLGNVQFHCILFDNKIINVEGTKMSINQFMTANKIINERDLKLQLQNYAASRIHNQPIIVGILLTTLNLYHFIPIEIRIKLIEQNFLNSEVNVEYLIPLLATRVKYKMLNERLTIEENILIMDLVVNQYYDYAAPVFNALKSETFYKKSKIRSFKRKINEKTKQFLNSMYVINHITQ